MAIFWRLIVLPVALGACLDRNPVPEARDPAPPAATEPASLAPPGSPADIRGIVTAADPGSIHIEADPSLESGSPKAIARLTPETVVLYRSGEAGDPADLTLGHNASVWFTGPVQESYPVRAAAGTIVIEPAGSI